MHRHDRDLGQFNEPAEYSEWVNDPVGWMIDKLCSRLLLYISGRSSGDSQLPGAGQLSGDSQLPGAGQLSGDSQLPGAGQLSGDSQLPDAGQLSGDSRFLAW
jgi:hypothetical protein